MIRRPPRATRTDTLFHYTTLFRSALPSRAKFSTARASSRHSQGIWALPPISAAPVRPRPVPPNRTEEHTSELQSLMRISYAVFCLKKKERIKGQRLVKKTIQHKNFNIKSLIARR